MPLREGDLVILVVCMAGLALILGGLFMYLGPAEEVAEGLGGEYTGVEEEEELRQEGRRGLRRRRQQARPRGVGGRGREGGMERGAAEDEEGEANGGEREEEGEEEGDEEIGDERELGVVRGASKKDRRKAEKRAMKEEARRQREAALRVVEESRRRRLERSRRESEKEGGEGGEGGEEEEEEAAEEEEFKQWSALMRVEGEGNLAEEEEEEEGLLGAFVAFIQERKVVLLDEVASEFKLSVTAVLQRLEALERLGRLSGVLDDRGKFIAVEEEELEQIRSFVVRKGRVRVSELASASNRLVAVKGKGGREGAREGAGEGGREEGDQGRALGGTGT